MAIGLGEDDLRPVARRLRGPPASADPRRHRVRQDRHAAHAVPGDRAHQRTDAARLLVVDFRRTLLGVVESDHLLGYAMSAASADAHVAAVTDLLAGRLPDEHVTQQQLRDRSWWSGPEVFVVVDDYDLVAGSVRQPVAAAARPAAARQGSRPAPGDRPSLRRCGAGDVRPDPGADARIWAPWA